MPTGLFEIELERRREDASSIQTFLPFSSVHARHTECCSRDLWSSVEVFEGKRSLLTHLMKPELLHGEMFSRMTRQEKYVHICFYILHFLPPYWPLS